MLFGCFDFERELLARSCLEREIVLIFGTSDETLNDRWYGAGRGLGGPAVRFLFLDGWQSLTTGFRDRVLVIDPDSARQYALQPVWLEGTRKIPFLPRERIRRYQCS